MAILATGNTFADGDQVTSTTLNNIANAATFQQTTQTGMLPVWVWELALPAQSWT